MIAVVLGFTKQEQAIVLFLIFALLTGSVVTLYQRFWRSESLPQVSAEYVEEFTKRAGETNRGADEPSGEQVTNVSEATGESVHSAVREKIPSTSSNYFLININAAGLEELQTIPRVGPVLAQKIIDYRMTSGGFKSIEELTQVKGIGNATFNKIRPYVSIK